MRLLIPDQIQHCAVKILENSLIFRLFQLVEARINHHNVVAAMGQLQLHLHLKVLDDILRGIVIFFEAGGIEDILQLKFGEIIFSRGWLPYIAGTGKVGGGMNPVELDLEPQLMPQRVSQSATNSVSLSNFQTETS